MLVYHQIQALNIYTPSPEEDNNALDNTPLTRTLWDQLQNPLNNTMFKSHNVKFKWILLVRVLAKILGWTQLKAEEKSMKHKCTWLFVPSKCVNIIFSKVQVVSSSPLPDLYVHCIGSSADCVKAQIPFLHFLLLFHY